MRTLLLSLEILWMAAPAGAQTNKATTPDDGVLFHDSHFHLTNYVQEVIETKFYLNEIMGDKVGRSTLFGIPLLQQWLWPCGNFDL